jgi:hypothetical protein
MKTCFSGILSSLSFHRLNEDLFQRDFIQFELSSADEDLFQRDFIQFELSSAE